MQIQPQCHDCGCSRILFDPDLVTDPSPALFLPSNYLQSGAVDTEEGRGSNYFVRHGESAWVLRHYRRGGLVGKVIHDRYFKTGTQNSRPWREWHLLALLHAEGFPVPRPVAAHYLPGLLTYRADLITEEIRGVTTLSGLLSQGGLGAATWLELGQLLRRFHRRGVFHADLNAHNILVDHLGSFFLLDFDRGELRSPGRWRESNLERLHRSLLKLKGQRQGFSFETSNWLELLHGYQQFPA